MSKGDYLGEFEAVVLLAVARLGHDAYRMTIRREIEERALRNAAIGGSMRPSSDWSQGAT